MVAGYTRRGALRTLATAGAVTVTGCFGDAAEKSANSTASVRGNERFRQSIGLFEPEYELEGELNVLQWINYWHNHAVPDFEDAYGVEVTVRLYESNEELRSILEADGTAAWDVVFPSDWQVTSMIEDGLLRPLELSKLSNWENLNDRWIDNAPYDVGEQRYSVPYQWGTTGIAWHEALIDGDFDDVEDLDSWDALWNDAYDGTITMLDLPREVFAVALKRLGYSLNTTDRDRIDEAAELLVQQRDLVGEYTAANLVDRLVNRKATPMHTFSGRALSAKRRLRRQGTSPITYRIPKEGGVVWVDTAAIPANARHPNAAHAFINYLLDGWVGAEISNYTFDASPNEAAREGIVDEILDDPAVYPDESTLDRLEFIRDLDETNQYYQEAWERVQHG